MVTEVAVGEGVEITGDKLPNARKKIHKTMHHFILAV